MALSLLNFFFWEIPEARAPFMIADSVVLIAITYIDRGMKAERKLRVLEAEHSHQHQESDKAAARAQNGATRQAQRNNKKNKGSNVATMKHHNNLQQPSKRD